MIFNCAAHAELLEICKGLLIVTEDDDETDI